VLLVFLVNSFKRGPFPDTCGYALLSYCIPQVPLLIVIAERSQFLPILRLTLNLQANNLMNLHYSTVVPYTVEGELGVAGFLVYFSKDHRVDLWLVWLAGYTCSEEVAKAELFPARLVQICPLILYPLPSLPESAFSCLAPQLDAAQHILINTLLKEGLETKLIASEASCSVRAVQRIRLKRQQFEMPTTRTNRIGCCSYITSPMQKALRDILIERPYLYRCEMADFLYRRFRKMISERSISQTLRSIGWTRTTIHRIAQQQDADLRDHYLHRIS
jgi:hypothetical protein